eukprot:comp18647_c0_seq1/m.20278 comp18647_c0_seq1/g.20278  ORF comp18647_c0_seq1/g.20278 comp18647_c0_seq1/m.20278 type:complete len:225 (-) comp18647_c0_seq1:393-1067(-)
MPSVWEYVLPALLMATASLNLGVEAMGDPPSRCTYRYANIHLKSVKFTVRDDKNKTIGSTRLYAGDATGVKALVFAPLNGTVTASWKFHSVLLPKSKAVTMPGAIGVKGDSVGWLHYVTPPCPGTSYSNGVCVTLKQGLNWHFTYRNHRCDNPEKGLSIVYTVDTMGPVAKGKGVVPGGQWPSTGFAFQIDWYDPKEFPKTCGDPEKHGKASPKTCAIKHKVQE